MSVKSVPGCLVASAPILIGVPLAFWPLPRPHFDVGPAAAFAGVLVALAPFSLLSPQAAISTARLESKATSTACGRGTVLLLLGLHESDAVGHAFAKRTAVRSPNAIGCRGGVKE